MKLIPLTRERSSAGVRPLLITRSQSLIALAGLVVAGVLGIGGTLVLRGAGNPGRTEHPFGPAGGDRVMANGLVEGASREAALFPEVPGTLAAVHVTVNQDVQAGALLFELTNETQKAQVALAEAELASAEAKLQHAKADWDRSREIRQSMPGAVSALAHDADRFRWQAAQAHLAEARARVRLAQAELAKTQVRAPINGRILQIHSEPGTLLEPRKNLEPVLRLADVSRRRVRAWVEELDVVRVLPGQRAAVSADGLPGQTFPGKVVEIAGRMGRNAPRSDRPGEREDMYYREVVIELDGGTELPVNLRVDVYLESSRPSQPRP